jgi:hypothetical protein
MIQCSDAHTWYWYRYGAEVCGSPHAMISLAYLLLGVPVTDVFSHPDDNGSKDLRGYVIDDNNANHMEALQWLTKAYHLNPTGIELDTLPDSLVRQLSLNGCSGATALNK